MTGMVDPGAPSLPSLLTPPGATALKESIYTCTDT
jgi:hypothetical protein